MTSSLHSRDFVRIVDRVHTCDQLRPHRPIGCRRRKHLARQRFVLAALGWLCNDRPQSTRLLCGRVRSLQRVLRSPTPGHSTTAKGLAECSWIQFRRTVRCRESRMPRRIIIDCLDGVKYRSASTVRRQSSTTKTERTRSSSFFPHFAI